MVPVVVVDTDEMLHHKWEGMVGDRNGNLEAASSVATTYHTCLSRDLLGLICAVRGLQRLAVLRLVIVPRTLDNSSSECQASPSRPTVMVYYIKYKHEARPA